MTKNDIPTPEQAQVYWLAALGLTGREIAVTIGVDHALVYAHLQSAVRKSARVGLSYLINRAPEIKEQKTLSRALLLAKEAGLI